MVRDIKALDSDMQTLVYENYNKFISATDTIRKVRRCGGRVCGWRWGNLMGWRWRWGNLTGNISCHSAQLCTIITSVLRGFAKKPR